MKKGPRPLTAGQVRQSGIAGHSALPALHQLRRDCRAELFLVARPTAWDVFICAKDLLVEAQAPKPFDLDQTFEPGVRNRRPTIDVGGSEDVREAVCPMNLIA